LSVEASSLSRSMVGMSKGVPPPGAMVGPSATGFERGPVAASATRICTG
jgi:hypothetical protein